MASRLGSAVASTGLVLVALVLAHDLTFLARYGSRFGEALVHGGHGIAWSAAVATSLAIGFLLVAIAGARIVRLAMRARRLASTGPASLRMTGGTAAAPSLARLFVAIGPRLAVLTAGLLTVQENAERAASGQAWAGPTILLTPEYAGGLWIALGIGLAVGFVAALLRWRVEVLRARIRSLRPRGPARPARVHPRPLTLALRPHASLLGRRSGLRAPPLATAP